MTTQQPSARLRPFRPSAFGRYTLLSPLSTGGMGEIFLARLEGAQGFEKLCVIKKILRHLSQDPEFVERFVNEAKTLAKLSHGSIAQVLDMGEHGGDRYLALEFVDGKDLRKVAARMRDRGMPLPLTVVLYVMCRVLDALAYVHRKRDDDDHELGLIHRDVSPQNVLISYEGEVKVIDFGLAKATASTARTNPSILLGKFLYMSPEHAKHQKVDRRSDLYSVGLCLWELIAGQNPFEDSPPGELMARVATPQIPALHTVEPLVPQAVEAAVMKALAVDPNQRFQSAEEFRGRLLSCLVEIDPTAGPESLSRFMREAFASEYHQERKLLASLREQVKVVSAASPTPVTLGSPLPAKREKEVDTAVFSLKDVAPNASEPQGPQLPTARRPTQPPLAPTTSPLLEPLSFNPTQRSRPPDSSEPDGQTVPSIVVEDLAALSEVGVSRELGRSAPTSPAAVVPRAARVEAVPLPGPPVGGPPVLRPRPEQTLEEAETESQVPAAVHGDRAEVVLGTPLDEAPPPHTQQLPGRSNPMGHTPRPQVPQPSRDADAGDTDEATLDADVSSDPKVSTTREPSSRRRRARWLLVVLLAVFFGILGVGAWVLYEMWQNSLMRVREEEQKRHQRSTTGKELDLEPLAAPLVPLTPEPPEPSPTKAEPEVKVEVTAVTAEPTPRVERAPVPPVKQAKRASPRAASDAFGKLRLALLRLGTCEGPECKEYLALEDRLVEGVIGRAAVAKFEKDCLALAARLDKKR